MKTLMTHFLVCLVVLVLQGCDTLPSNQVKFTVRSQPPGAMIYEGNTAWGVAPQTRYYTGDTNIGNIRTNPITAIWSSGAKASTFFNLPMGQGDREYVFSRPPDAPGLSVDLDYAAQVQQQASNQQSADAQQRAARAQERANKAAIINSIYAPRTRNTNCTTYGNTMNCSSY